MKLNFFSNNAFKNCSHPAFNVPYDKWITLIIGKYIYFLHVTATYKSDLVQVCNISYAQFFWEWIAFTITDYIWNKILISENTPKAPVE